MSRFVPLKVLRIVNETAEANTVVFEKPAGSDFNYLAGQYLTLKVDVNGESLRRAYSLCSSPVTDSELAVTVKRVDDGRVSNYIASNVKAGDTIEVFPPMGKFHVEVNAARAHHYVLIGAGSGITPLMSIIKTVLSAEPNSKLTLVYGNRNQASIIFSRELEGLSAQYADRFRVVHSLSQPTNGWTGLTGRLTRHALLAVGQDIINADALPKSYWLCGPNEMMEEAQTALGFLGVQKSDIHRESFTAPLPDPDKEKPAAPAEGKRGTYTVKVILDDAEQEVVVDEKSTILEAVIGKGMDPPYACQMGVCCTCRAKLTSGQVEMEEDEGLSDAEIEDGFILTCQAHPLTADCVLEYM